MNSMTNIVAQIDDYVAMRNELDDLRAENARLRDYVGDGLLRSDYKNAAEMRIEINRLKAEVARQHEEILHLSIYAPGQHQAHVVKPIPRIGPTDWRFYGLELAEADFDAFWHTVPNESEL